MGSGRWKSLQIQNIKIGLFVMLFFVLLRLEYLYWNWAQFKMSSPSEIFSALLLGLRFDLSATAYLLMPLFLMSFLSFLIELPRKLYFGLVLVWLLPWFVLNFVDIEFVNFVGRRWTLSGLFIWSEAQGKWAGFISTYAVWILIGGAQIGLWAWGLWRWLSSERRNVWGHWLLISFLSLVFLVVASRGGFQKKPLGPIHANIFTAPVLNNLSLNSTFTLLKSFGKNALPKVKYFEQRDEMLSHLNGGLNLTSVMESQRPPGPQNVVIIVMESMGLEYLGKTNGVPGYTPFFDELSSRPGALFFKNGFANGRRSIEGIAAVIAGVPALMSEPFISSDFSTNKFFGLGSLLQTMGRESSFFHGGANGTMYFDTFSKSAGIQKYVGLNEYPNPKDDFDGTWGIFDRPFFQFFLKSLNQSPKPFASLIFTLSAHHPYKIPDQEKSRFPNGPIEILGSIAYADDSLREFFKEAEKQDWFKNTLFVITADHTQKNYLPQYENEISKYKIPVLFYHEGMSWKGIDRDQIVQQIDLLPSVMDFLGVPLKEKNYLGSSVFVTDGSEKTSLHYNDGRYLLVAKNYFLDWKEGHDPEMYSRQDEFQKNVIQEPVSQRKILIQKAEAGIQYFSEGLWDNKLYFPAK